MGAQLGKKKEYLFRIRKESTAHDRILKAEKYHTYHENLEKQHKICVNYLPGHLYDSFRSHYGLYVLSIPHHVTRIL